MIKSVATPRTLSEAIRYFQDPDRALAYVVQHRWPAGVGCPRCGDTSVAFLESRRIWKCRGCQKQFSAKVGTIFEDSPLGFDKWLPALWMLANCKNGVSSYEVSRALGVTQKTAWFMLGRIRLALRSKSFQKWGGEVEVDESAIGGKSVNMHRAKRKRVIKRGMAWPGKTAVAGILRRGPKGKSRVRGEVVLDVGKQTMTEFVNANVVPGAEVFTDSAYSYRDLHERYVHKMVDHAVAYVVGRVHTNTLENFWSLLKRAIKGTYVSVDPFHLFRYLDEQMFRFNNRDVKDGDRFALAARMVFGKRLTWRDLTGKDLEPATT